jgi:hypothetical protein
MSGVGANGKANGTASGELKVLVKFLPLVAGRGIDRRTLDRFLDEIEAIFYELEVQELELLLALVDEQLDGEARSLWDWAKHAAYHKLKEAYAGRRFHITGAPGDGLVLEIAVAAAAFGVLKEALDRTQIRARLDGSRQGLLNRAESSHKSSLIVLRDAFLKSEMFDVHIDDARTQLTLTARLDKQQDLALPTMHEFVAWARKSSSIWHSLDIRAPLGL